MTKTIGVIGLGSIFPHQLYALSRVRNLFQLTAICDLSEEKLKKGMGMVTDTLGQEDISRYSSPELFVHDERTETILIATPPHTHYTLTKMALEAGRNVIVEKPAVLDLTEFEDLRHTANELGLFLHVAYHAAFAPDLIWYINHRIEIEKEYSLGEILKINCGFYDPYIINEHLVEDKGLLGGSYLDSTVNELSVCNALVPLEKYTTKSFFKKRMGTHDITCCSSLVLETPANIRMPLIICKTDWTLGLNEKKTTLHYSNGTILLHHSNQTVSVNCNKGNIHLFDNGEEPRLPTHYANLFTDYVRRYENMLDNYSESVVIHRILLSNLSDTYQ